MVSISVIIPTYNPDAARLGQTLAALKSQSFPLSQWELIIIDNNSSNHFAKSLDLSWHPAAKIVTEEKQGLTYARIKGISVARGGIIIMADDDNVLDKNYLQNVDGIFKDNPGLGSIGGKSIPRFESPSPQWLSPFYDCLALRDLGDTCIINTWRNDYPAAAPIGAGMAIRKNALQAYISAHHVSTNIVTDRTATSLSSGGDNEINLAILKSGWAVGYFPELVLEHIIPAERMTIAYMARLVFGINRSWAILLTKHKISPWGSINKNTLLLRKLKSYLSNKAWQGESNYLRWKAACGIFQGLAEGSDE
ncbi:glycosyltransferase family 2 protein [Mucilaginibacter sp. ZT4R22]|uniref:Glycosyltransferase family 2 protein n=1 Tax=Mucilaginibacter pankratovii TaxID=2772110 RepID=A0ABR7WNV7_9SPHI|nr:glycosyltransferase [Mucilaginibacter pankratovii]MBD1363972.1 glycosyltransferase family 2 protein [Mucilaginibacter pankratovii]